MIRARHSSLCPYCGRWILAGRSRIVRLSEPLAPQRPYYLRDLCLGTVRDARRRRYVHERCALAAERLISEQVAS